MGLLLSAATTAAAHETSRFEACSRGDVLTSEGIGPLRIGLTPDSLKKVCRVVSERRIAEYEMTQFRVLVRSDTLLVHEQRGRIFWIVVSSNAFRTVDSLAVGSPLDRLLAFDNLDGGIGDGDDAYELHTHAGTNCGLVFWVDSRTAMAVSDIARADPASRLGRPTGAVLEALRQRAKTGTVKSIDVRGCKR